MICENKSHKSTNERIYMITIISTKKLEKIEHQVLRNEHAIKQLEIAVNKIHKRYNKKDKTPKLVPDFFKIGGSI